MGEVESVLNLYSDMLYMYMWLGMEYCFSSL